MGDGIQAAKAGILEVADVLVVNKADREGADRTVRDLRHAVQMGEGSAHAGLAGAGGSHGRRPTAPGWTTSSRRSRPTVCGSGDDGLRARRVRRAAREVEGLALEALRSRVGGLRGDARLEVLAGEVVDGRTDPYAAADRLGRARLSEPPCGARRAARCPRAPAPDLTTRPLPCRLLVAPRPEAASAGGPAGD